MKKLFNKIKTNKQENKKIIINKSIIFYITLGLTALFILSPLFLRFSIIKNIVAFFFEPLTYENYKSSFIETIGSIVGTILAITGTLFLQKKIDQKVEEEKKEKEEIDIRRRIIVIYYDLKLAFDDISVMYKLFIFSSFFVNNKPGEEFYKSASKIELYVDNNWIQNVASLHDVFDEELLEKIFLIYGDICSIKNGLKTDNYDEYQYFRMAELIGKYFNGMGNPELKSEYKDLLEKLRVEGKINENTNKNDEKTSS